MKQASVTLDKLTRTFAADRKFFDSLMAQPCGESFMEMCVWYVWLQDYLHDIQNSIHDAGETHGSDYQLWVVSMIGGSAQSIGMLMYLLARGVVHEAAASGRRALEYLGMASHLIRDPSKARFLCEEETSSVAFTKAFIRGMDQREADRMKNQEGIRYRFAGMSAGMAKLATELYEIFSRFKLHGGTLSSMVGLATGQTAHSCAFHNRSLEAAAQNLPLFKPILEITAVELVDLVGNYGVRSKRVNEAGACVVAWLNRNDPRWLDRLQMMRRDFGLSAVSRPN